LLFSQYISNFNFYHSYFQEFKEFHDHNYKTNKGETKIWIEFSVFLFLYFNLVLSYLMVYFTDPGMIPNDQIWSINVPDNLPAQVQLEIYAVKLVIRDEQLKTNKNILSDENLNDDTRTTFGSKCNFVINISICQQ
jgi:hypothetical protein